MTKWDKLIYRVLDLSNDMRFEELKKILESYGYKMNMPKSGSSHVTFRKKGRPPITLVRTGAIKKVYIQQVKKIILEEQDEKN